MKIAKFATGSILISSFLMFANADKAAQAHPIQTTNFAAIQSRSTHPTTSPANVRTPITTAPTSVNRISNIFNTGILRNVSLIGTSKVTTVSTRVRVDVAGSTSTTLVPTSSQTAQQEITAVLNNDWASWTGSANGRLTIAEVGKLLTNPKITGSQAAVLGMIADQMNSDISSSPNISPSYTQAQTQAFVLGTSASSSAIFSTTGPLAALPYYTTAMSQIASSTNSNGTFNLYGSYKAPQLAGIQQGALGDCFYLSALESVLNENPQLIANMIKQNSNGTFTVSFPHGPKETVTLTDGEIANFNIAPNNGAWLAVMGIAENQVLESMSTSARGFAITGAQKSSPLGVISDGGFPTQTLSLLTGQSYGALSSSQQQYFSLSYINNLLQLDMSSKTPIGVESQDHALAIIGFNVSNDMVTILNPWGTTGAYGAYEDPGVSNPWMNVQMVNGVFTLSTAQMLLDFSSITAPTAVMNSNFSSAARIGVTAASSFVSTGNMYSSTLSPKVMPLTLPQTYSALNNSSTYIPQARISLSTQANLIGDQDITDGRERQVSFESEASACAAGSESTYEAGQGSLLVMHDSPVQIQTERATVHVAAHAAALIIQIGNEVAVSNLCDKHMGDVAVFIGDNRIDVPQGRAILLGDATVDDATKIQLVECLYGQACSLGKYNNSSAFLGRASYVWALKNCPQFRELTHSANPSERKAAMKVLKTGAAVMTMVQGRQS